MIEALSLLPFGFFFPVAAALAVDLGNWVDPDPNPSPGERGLLFEGGCCSSIVGLEDEEESWEIMVNLGLVEERDL